MSLKPVGHRILVTPDTQDDQTASGLVLPGDRDYVPVSGIVSAVGDGPERDQRIRLACIARCMSIVEELGESVESKQRHCDSECDEAWQLARDIVDEMRRYKNQVEQFDGTLQVGDRVVYPAESGLKVSQDGQDYILLNEDDVVVIATEEAAA